jgi:hypothetical protein
MNINLINENTGGSQDIVTPMVIFISHSIGSVAKELIAHHTACIFSIAEIGLAEPNQ